MKEETIWKFWDDECETYEEYEKSKPKTILEEYGKALEKDTNNLLTYKIVENIIGNSDMITTFYCIVNDKTNYNMRFFEITYNSLKIYPCCFQNLLSQNKYTCNNIAELKETIEKEIKYKDTKLKIGRLLYSFYDKETIDKLRNSD